MPKQITMFGDKEIADNNRMQSFKFEYDSLKDMGEYIQIKVIPFNVKAYSLAQAWYKVRHLPEYATHRKYEVRCLE